MNGKQTVAASRNRSRSAVPQTRTLGPVSDLERHLPSEWWKTLFNSLYVKTDGDVVENPENTRRDVDMIVRLARLEPNDRILDMCCGQGRHSLELAERGFRHVTGMDRSRYLIRLARKRARAGGLSVHFHEGDARKLRWKNEPFHCVTLMGNSFGYFEHPADDEAVLGNVARVLVPQGTLVLDIVEGEWMRDHFEARSWEWIDKDHFVCRERALSKDRRRIVTREVITHAEKGIIADQFYAERVYTREQIHELLEKVGYQTVRLHGTVESESTRGQDLGMMAHRLILTATAPPRKATAVARSAPAFQCITVLQGDPSLPDKVKNEGVFNSEDMDTIDRMKEALAELGEFRFRYLDNHQNLIRALVSEPPDFVFNLCDEGFLNDAFLELHVPAVLEMLQVPYSGAGPACLGLCYNKNLVRAIAESLEVPVPMESYLGADDNAPTLPSTFPALIKPNYGDSSIGITQHAVVRSADELLNHVNWIRHTLGSVSILVQEFLTGPEYSVGVVGNPGMTYKVLPVLEVDYSGLDPDLPQILGYESKWMPDSPYWTQIRYKEAELDDESQRRLLDYSNALFERLGCRDYARFDFRADSEGNIKLLEANPNPGWCWD
ncbi:methyltransferase domain-containing protein, partial [bacterium]|nr:methyltransferase domain-containing protein [bacterium]